MVFSSFTIMRKRIDSYSEGIELEGSQRAEMRSETKEKNFWPLYLTVLGLFLGNLMFYSPYFVDQNYRSEVYKRVVSPTWNWISKTVQEDMVKPFFDKEGKVIKIWLCPKFSRFVFYSHLNYWKNQRLLTNQKRWEFLNSLSF